MPSNLFEPVQLGASRLANRIVMAPLMRISVTPGSFPAITGRKSEATFGDTSGAVRLQFRRAL